MIIYSVMDYLHKFYFYHCKTMLHINKKNEKKNFRTVSKFNQKIAETEANCYSPLLFSLSL